VVLVALRERALRLVPARNPSATLTRCVRGASRASRRDLPRPAPDASVGLLLLLQPHARRAVLGPRQQPQQRLMGPAMPGGRAFATSPPMLTATDRVDASPLRHHVADDAQTSDRQCIKQNNDMLPDSFASSSRNKNKRGPSPKRGPDIKLKIKVVLPRSGSFQWGRR